jgi:hypothetical protein
MNNRPNYNLYHTHELKKRLTELDPKNNQDEIQEIQKLIDSGGYQFPSIVSETSDDTGQTIKRTAVATNFKSSKFILALYFTISILLLLNFYNLIAFGVMISIIPIVFQSLILYCLYNAHTMSKILVKIWATLLMISGFFGLISVIFGESISISQIIMHTAYLIVGAYVWKKASQTMEIIYAKQDDSI